MRLLTLGELMCLTRTELCVLAAKISAALSVYREGSPELMLAYANGAWRCDRHWPSAKWTGGEETLVCPD